MDSYDAKKWPRLRQVEIKGRTYFQVDGRPFGRRETFAAEDEAKTRAWQLQVERENKGIEALEFPTELRVDAQEAERILRPFGKSLVEGAKEAASVFQQQQRHKKAPLVSQCLDDWLNAARNRGPNPLAVTTISELESRARIFRDAFGNLKITELAEEKVVKDFLLGLHSANGNVVNIRNKLGNFLNHCMDCDLITTNPVPRLTWKKLHLKPTGVAHEVATLSPAQCEKLLFVASESEWAEFAVPYAAVEMFAGLRPGEADGLRWELVNFDTLEIKVLAETSKTRETRYVPMEPVCVEWLLRYRKPRGLLRGTPNFWPKWSQIRADAGFALLEKAGEPWIADLLRHCFGSYWLAIFENRARLAEIMGNSEDVIKAHYRKAVPKSDAKAFWALTPDAVLASIEHKLTCLAPRII